MVIKAYFINDVLACTCDGKGIPLTKNKVWKRNIPDREINFEKSFIFNINNENFSEKKSMAYLWIDIIFFNLPKPKHFEIYSIAKFFSIQMKIQLGREVYRRKRNCIFWLEKNMDTIQDICTKNKITFLYNNKIVEIKPYQDFLEKETVQKSDDIATVDLESNINDEEYMSSCQDIFDKCFSLGNINDYDKFDQSLYY